MPNAKLGTITTFQKWTTKNLIVFPGEIPQTEMLKKVS